jgi:hypothetical protein
VSADLVQSHSKLVKEATLKCRVKKGIVLAPIIDARNQTHTHCELMNGDRKGPMQINVGGAGGRGGVCWQHGRVCRTSCSRPAGRSSSIRRSLPAAAAPSSSSKARTGLIDATTPGGRQRTLCLPRSLPATAQGREIDRKEQNNDNKRAVGRTVAGWHSSTNGSSSSTRARAATTASPRARAPLPVGRIGAGSERREL